MAEAVVRIEHLTKRFGDLEVLRDVSMEVDRGEVVVIFGRSGSGKSTLLRCVNFLEDPTSGAIEVAGMRLEGGHRTRHKLERIRQLRTRCGMVFQQFNLFPHMTAVGNVMEGLRTVKRIARDAARTRAEKELARVGLADKAETYPAHLSGGQKQRVAIARALAMDPELLLFDEPTSALDPELVGEVLNVIRALADEGRTMLLVTHELGFAYHVATRVIFLADGTIHEQGTPDEILKSPQKERTKAFLARHKEFSL